MDTRQREALFQELQCTLGKKAVAQDVPMSRHTTLKLGGPAELFCEAESAQGLSQTLQIAKRYGVPVTVLGNGSNMLVKDGGLRGLVLHIGDGLSGLTPPLPLPDGRFAITAEAGATLVKLANFAAEHSLTGLEFAAGIPGTVGGAVSMNAGAYGGEMKDVVLSITACDAQGKPHVFSGPEMGFGYRKSRLNQGGEVFAAVSVTVALGQGESETIRTAMREFNARRREKQPLALPSCGSTFKRPPGQFAGTLIEQCGLKGHRIGGASVSELHAGFLVNDGEGTAEDYLALIAHVQRAVFEQTGVSLEPEVRILGEDTPVTLL